VPDEAQSQTAGEGRPKADVWERAAHAVSERAASGRIWDQTARALDFSLYRPRRAAGILEFKIEGAPAAAPTADEGLLDEDETGYYVLKNPEHRTYLRINPREYHLWTTMNGERDVDDLAAEYLEQFGTLGLERVGSLVRQLRQGHFLSDSPADVYEQIATRAASRSIGARLRLVGSRLARSEFELPGVGAAANFLARYLRGVIRFLFTRPFLFVTLVVCLAVALSGAWRFSRLFEDPRLAFFRVGEEGALSLVLGLLALWALNLLSSLIHDGARGLVAVSSGCEVTRGGVVLRFGLLQFFADLRDAAVLDQRERKTVDSVGLLADVVVAGVCGLLIDPAGGSFLFKLGLVCYLRFIARLSPFGDSDLYRLLSERWDQPLLRVRALQFLRAGLWQRLRRHERFSRDDTISVYCGVWMIWWLSYVAWICGHLVFRRLGDAGMKADFGFAPQMGAFGRGLAWVVAAGVLVSGLISLLRSLWYFVKYLCHYVYHRRAWRKTAHVALLFVVAGLILAAGHHYVEGAASDAWQSLAAGTVFTLIVVLGLASSARAASETRAGRAGRHRHVPLATEFNLLVAFGLLLLISTVSGLVQGPRVVTSGSQVLSVALLFVFGAFCYRNHVGGLHTRSERGSVVAAAFLLAAALAPICAALGGDARVSLPVREFVCLLLLGVTFLWLVPVFLSYSGSEAGSGWTLLLMGVAFLLAGGLAGGGLAPAARIRGAGFAGSLYLFGLAMIAASLGVRLIWDVRAKPAVKACPLFRAESDLDRLRHGVGYLVASLMGTLRAHCGARRSEILAQLFNRQSERLGWEMYLAGERLVDAAEERDLVEASEVARMAVLWLDERMAGVAGRPFVDRTLQAVQDRLPWEDREILSYHLFHDTEWGELVEPIEAVSRDERKDILRKTVLFQGLQEDELDDLASCLSVQHAARGEAIVRQGDDGDRFYLVTTGTLRVDVDDPDGAVRTVGYLHAGDYFGEIALLQNVPRTATVTALEDTDLLVMMCDHFQSFVSAREDASEKVVDMINHIRELRRIPLFREYADGQIGMILSRVREERAAAGETIIAQGDVGDRFYILRRGTARVTHVDEDGVEHARARLNAGEYFGEIALLKDIPRTATVTASTDVVLWSLSKNDFLDLLAGDKYLSQSVQQTASRRLTV